LFIGNWPGKLSPCKKALASAPSFAQHWDEELRGAPPDMKAKIIITPKKAVLDPQGKTVQNALAHMGYAGIGAVHVGKYLEIELTGEKEAARRQLDEACHKFLSNPVIEDYRLEIE
jgi:phosphoribosylformylglycinamidine synthase PurS subunit